MAEAREPTDVPPLTVEDSLRSTDEARIEGPIKPNMKMKWRQMKFKKNGPSPRSGHISKVLNGKMIIFGGYCKQMLTDHIFLVDIDHLQNSVRDLTDQLSVTPISSLEKVHKTFRVGHAAVTLQHNHSLYLYGGWNDQEYVNYGLLFNLNSLKLVVEQTKNRRLPQPRRDHSLVKMGPYLLLFGGWSHQYNNGNDLWCLDSSWKWQPLDVNGVPPCPRRGHSAVVIGSRMYIFGGLYGFSKYLNDLYVYNGDTNSWIKPAIVGNSECRPQPRAWHSASVIGNSNQFLIFGGTAGRLDFFNDLWIFDTDARYWFQITITGNVPLPRADHTLAEVWYDKPYMESLQHNETGGTIMEDHETEDYYPGGNSEQMDIGSGGGRSNNPNPSRVRLRMILFGGLVPRAVDPDDIPPMARKTFSRRTLFPEYDKKIRSIEESGGGNGSISLSTDTEEEKEKTTGSEKMDQLFDNNSELNLGKVSQDIQTTVEKEASSSTDGTATAAAAANANGAKSDEEEAEEDDKKEGNAKGVRFDPEPAESGIAAPADDDVTEVNKIELSDDVYELILEI